MADGQLSINRTPNYFHSSMVQVLHERLVIGD